MATKVNNFTLLGMIEVVVESEQSPLTSTTKKEMTSENRSYWQLSYKPKSSDKECAFNIFDDDKLYNCAGFALKDDSDEAIERLVAEQGEEARDSIIGKFNRSKQLRTRTCYNIKFAIPEGYKYLSLKDGKVQTRKDYELEKEGDLSSLKEVEKEVEIKEFNYWVADKEPDQRYVARMLATMGKFVKVEK